MKSKTIKTLFILIIFLVVNYDRNTITVANDINDNNNVTINHHNDYNETLDHFDYNKTIIHVHPSKPVRATITSTDSNNNNMKSNNRHNSTLTNIYNYFTKSSSSISKTSSAQIMLEDYTPSGTDSTYPFYNSGDYMRLKAWEFLKGYDNYSILFYSLFYCFNNMFIGKTIEAVSGSFTWKVIIQSDGNINVRQIDSVGDYNLGWCSNNDGCREIYEGECYNGRVNDAQCAMWVVSQGDTCGSMKRFAYVYFTCEYGTRSNYLNGVTESPTCVYRIYFHIDCSDTASLSTLGYGYVYTCPKYNLIAGQTATCQLQNFYASNLNVTVTGCSGIAAYVGDTQLIADVSGMTINYNDNTCSTGSEVSSIIVPTGKTLTLTESCKSGSCSGRYQVGVKTGVVYSDASSWITVPGQLHYGNDIQYFGGTSSKESCINNCKNTNGCLGASYKASNGDCWVHSAITDIRQSSEYVLLLPPFLAVPYLSIEGLDVSNGNDMTSYSNTNKAQCMINCKYYHSGCIAASFPSTGTTCWLKNVISSPSTYNTANLLVYPGAVLSSVHFPGNDISQYASGGVLLLSLTL